MARVSLGYGWGRTILVVACGMVGGCTDSPAGGSSPDATTDIATPNDAAFENGIVPEASTVMPDAAEVKDGDGPYAEGGPPDVSDDDPDACPGERVWTSDGDWFSLVKDPELGCQPTAYEYSVATQTLRKQQCNSTDIVRTAQLSVDNAQRLAAELAALRTSCAAPTCVAGVPEIHLALRRRSSCLSTFYSRDDRSSCTPPDSLPPLARFIRSTQLARLADLLQALVAEICPTGSDAGGAMSDAGTCGATLPDPGCDGGPVDQERRTAPPPRER